MPIQEKCRILDHKQVGSRHYQLTLASPYISSHASPGQFVQVKCSDSYDPLLRRPISLHRINPTHQTFTLLYEVVGKGTGLLTKYFVGESADILGPLGHGFELPTDKRIALLVGGGLGVAPLLALAERLKDRAVYVLIGAKTKELIVVEGDFRQTNSQVIVTTDDGSYGKKGLISDLLLDVLQNVLGNSQLPQTTIYACGPRVMLKAVAEIAAQKMVSCQLSLEERMACGVGACKGCAVLTRQGYKMACVDGPVFDHEELLW